MFRLLAVFVVLFAGAAACISLLPSPPTAQPSSSAVAAQLRHEAESAPARAGVRVVYPGPGATVTPNRTISGAETTPAVPTPAVAAAGPLPAAAPVPSAAVYPQVQSSLDGDTATVPANPAAQAGAPGVNLNTASVDTLNQIPGAGRIGRMIASHRPYRSVEDLLTKRVVKRSVYDRIKDQVAAE